MKVLVLGGSGYVGSRLCALLAASGWATPVAGSSRRTVAGAEAVRVDTRDAAALRTALRDVDAVVNCVAGNAAAIGEGARVLARTALEAGCRRIVHLSSMAVYGTVEGRVDESTALDGSLGWYAQAKCEAERHMNGFAERGGAVTILRPGCVWGPGSDLWVGRIARFLQAGRLGDLGAAGDGWSNLVHVDDVCQAVLAALRDADARPGVRTYNLAAPDSPRWNEYFVDLALAIGATPVRRLSSRQLRLDAMLAGPPLKVAEILAKRLLGDARFVPVPLPPNLLGLWERHLRLDASRASRELGLQWTPYAVTLQQSAAWFLQQRPGSLPDVTVLRGGDSPT
ncbi:NAD-dependent epimerase/dehydratase family protein [Ramlibacter sp.]|uniref:NAD-dependent epimerase/dehydratase family protein n=1 Tax=Ramlibacter sp. TaxID=1917967 RepID=UPI002CE49F5A|nr:NAD-dependent epimerase/dehydratase family protein [Ramlibacter sp.]HWI82325.1 NAD-dependent epimerase/dehydratase family protein [Ramlibacter sp.]